ncbi:PPE family protein [Mycobacterium lacus]|uniref:PPE family protein n=1 Tax=Mycobacterium lacus TaxID=169765 RepID=A0A7I7NF07_9MYCO|nr:PPE family protein [Mycobacterium lacus]
MYAALPPEINSGRMYAGPGAGSMLAAAAAWDALAGELSSTAISFESVISGLTSGAWLGASSVAMAAAAAPYVTWLRATAAQVEQVASQARAAVAGYEAAYAMTVPPALVAANRAQLMTLIATNLLGQNFPAIAATEAQYGEMWAQDATAMYGYAAASAAATNLTPFTEPPQIANPAGLAAQAGALTQATGNSAANNVVATLSQLTSAVSPLLQAAGDSNLPQWVEDLSTVMSILGTPFFVCTSSAGLMMSAISTIKGFAPAAAAVASQVATGLGAAASEAAAAMGSATLSGVASAGLGQATTVGALSVPPAWAASAPTLSPSAMAALPGAAMSAAPSAGPAGGAPGLLGGLPMSASPGRAEAAGNGAQDGIAPLRVLPQLI